MISGKLDVKAGSITHAGLWLDKFVRRTDSLGDTLEIKAATPAYKLAFARWREHWESAGEGIVVAEGKVRDRLAIGLGAKGVLDNGLRLQFTYGAPLIPGSSLKGILKRGLPDTHRNSERNPKNVEWYLFGGEGRVADPPQHGGPTAEIRSRSDFKGTARFHDAWWIPRDGEPAFDLDVMTPHHRDYISGKGPPTDFDEPVPVPFLTVQGKFLFVIETPGGLWRDYVRALLKETLSRDGAGAKRAAGYGSIEVE